jgi:hypothetical protein
MNEELFKKLMGIRLDKYAVDQGMMLNMLVGALTEIVAWADKNGKVDAKSIVDAVERAHIVNVVNN